MSRGITFPQPVTDTTLPIIRSFDTQIREIAGLSAWFTIRADKVTIDGSDRVAAVSCRAGLGTTLSQADADKRPLFALSQVNGRPGAQYLRSRPDSLRWSGALPIGAGAKWTMVGVVSAIPSGQAELWGFMGNNNDGAQMYVSTGGLLKVYVNRDGSTHAYGNVQVNDGLPHWFVASYDQAAGKISIRVDDNDTESDTFEPILTDSGVVYLGVLSTAENTANAFTGTIPDALIFSGTDLLASANAAQLAVIREYMGSVWGLAA
jgi:hypothetical protein